MSGEHSSDDHGAGGPPRTSGKAVASLVLGLMSFCLSVFAGLPAIVLGVLGLNEINRSGGRVTGQVLAISGIALGSLGTLVMIPLVGVSLALLLPALNAARDAARAAASLNNMKQIGLAMTVAQLDQGSLPPAYEAGADGTPLTSWRVLLLPYLEVDGTYSQYDLGQPWDAPVNQQVAAIAPSIYRAPFDNAAPPSDTSYVVVQGPGTAFVGSRRLTQNELATRGLSQTVLLAEMHDSGIGWTEPRDLSIDRMSFAINDSSRPSIRSNARRVAIGMADGSVHTLAPSTSPDLVESLLLGHSVEAIDDTWP